jgi:hypothetical protein
MAERKRLEQLRHMSWQTRQEAASELKRCGVPEVGEDYELGEFSPGSWQLLDRTDNASQEVVNRPKAPPRRPLPKLPKVEPEPAPKTRPGPKILSDMINKPFREAKKMAARKKKAAAPVEQPKVKAKGKAKKSAPPPEPKKRGFGEKSTTGKTVDAEKLLFRKNGATKKELVAITGWSFGESYIERIAKRTGARVETLGPRHWRLIKS